MRELKICIFAGLWLVAPVILAQSPSKALSQAKEFDKQVSELSKAGKYSEALPLAIQSLEIREKALKAQHPDVATGAHALAVIYDKLRNYAKAEPLHQRALAIRERALGPDHPDTAQCLNDLGVHYAEMGNYAKAEPFFQRALKIREKSLGPEDPATADCLSSLGQIYNKPGTYAEAENFFKRALEIQQKIPGLENVDTAGTLSALAVLYVDMGDYGKAEPLYQSALAIYEKILGPDHVEIADCLNNLGLLYYESGDYAKAESFYERSLKIAEKGLGPESPDAALRLHNLAVLYHDLGDYNKAEILHKQALRIREKVFGPEHAEVALSLNNLGRLYVEIGDFDKAEAVYQRALRIREKVHGPDAPAVARVLNNLGLLHFRKGDYTTAKVLFQRALRIHEKAYGPNDVEVAASVGHLAKLSCYAGEYSEGKALYERALRIEEKVRGSAHPLVANILNDMALCLIDAGDFKEARHEGLKGQRADEKILSNILSFTSESQRFAFQKTTKPYDVLGTLGNAAELAQTVLRRKGIVLDSLLEDRLLAAASADPKQHEALSALRSARQRLTKLQLELPKDISQEVLKKREAQKKELIERVDKLEAVLARHLAGFGRSRRALSVTAQDIQSVLGKSETLVELLRYSHYLGKNKWEARYGAVVIPPKGDATWAPLGAAEEIEKNIRLYQKSVRGKTDEAALSNTLCALHSQVWAPIENSLPPGTSMIIISPDGELSFTSFATLIGPDDKFLSEKYSIRYVASGRDLLRDAKPTADPKTTMRVFANPDFGGIVVGPRLAQTNTPVLRSAEMRDLEGISLPNLPGTEKESVQLEACANKSGWQPQTYLSAKATEAELRQVNSPRILHLATHGFFLPEIDLGVSKRTGDAAEIPKGKLVNPMHRSGLAMAGAQSTLQSWAKGEVPPIENDGIVTAEEVGGLKLEGTWLVVLSACDTGGGEAKAGEGVMGLRRGFVQAGGQNLLMTLWPISDETTVNIMLDFYDAAFKTGNAPQALAETQRDWLVKLRKERGLLPAVQLAGPFIMSSQGKP